MRTIAIVGAGLSGLSLAYRLERLGCTQRIVVLEAGPGPGGTAQTTEEAGYTFDHGPNGFLTNVHFAWDLAQELGLPTVSAADTAKQRYIWGDGRLEPAPLDPAAFFRSRLLSWPAKLRVALEPFAPSAPPDTDESVYAFAQRRLGRDFAEAFIRPMVLGVTAGDARAISLRSLFPRMWAMEHEHGGLLRALVARKLAARRGRRLGDPDVRESGGPAGPGGRLTTIAEGGISGLVRGLCRALRAELRLNCPVSALHRDGEQWALSLPDGESLRADTVVLACPAWAVAELLQPWADEAAEAAAAIPYAGVAVVGLGYSRTAFPKPPVGFGFLVPPQSGLRLLGCLWTSSCFPQQAPADKVLLRVLVGGSVHPEMLELDDEALFGQVRDGLRLSMGVSQAPEWNKLVRWRRGIPQYLPGHAARVDALRRELARHPGLHVLGNAFGGIGVNDCVRDANRLAEQLGPELTA